MSEGKLVEAAEAMSADGRYELAERTLTWARARLPESEPLARAERLANLKLMEKHQSYNPFKFIVYAGKMGIQVPLIETPAHK